MSILVTIILSIKLDIVDVNINEGNNWFSNVLLFIRKSISIDNFKTIVTFLCMYFLPDLEEFKAGLHSYRELDLPYEEAFGKLSTSS